MAMNTILIVGDSPNLIAVLGKMLAPVGQVRFATSGAAALARMRDEAPDLVLLDAEMPGMDGFTACQTMKTDPVLGRIPVIFVTSHNATEAELRGLNAGAVDFISKPVNEPVLLARVKTHLRLKQLSDELQRRAASDALTGLANRGHFDQRLQLEWARAARGGEALSLILLDVDHFKKFNDRYGHPAGDACLRAVADALALRARRSTDLVARVGGEEFAVLLPHTHAAGAQQAAEQLRAAVAALGIPHGASDTAAHVTISLGVASWQPVAPVTADGPQALIDRADRALYAAKSQGRNRIHLASVAPPATAPTALLAERGLRSARGVGIMPA